MTPKTQCYNYRLFEESWLRRTIHNSRFEWFRNTMAALYGNRPVACVELGCFDGRLLQYFPVAPSHYQGLDAGFLGAIKIDVVRARRTLGAIAEFAISPCTAFFRPYLVHFLLMLFIIRALRVTVAFDGLTRGNAATETFGIPDYAGTICVVGFCAWLFSLANERQTQRVC